MRRNRGIARQSAPRGSDESVRRCEAACSARRVHSFGIAAKRRPRRHRAREASRLPAVRASSDRAFQGTILRGAWILRRALAGTRICVTDAAPDTRCSPIGEDEAGAEVHDSRYADGTVRRISGRRQHVVYSGRRNRASIRHSVSGRWPVSLRTLDVVVLNDDLPAHGLKKGDLGTVVDVYAPDALEVEFVTASGKTQALVTLSPSMLRDVADDDLVTVRPSTRRNV